MGVHGHGTSETGSLSGRRRRRFEFDWLVLGEELSRRPRQNDLFSRASRLVRRLSRPSGAGFSWRHDDTSGADSPRCLRQPGQPVRRARLRPVARSGPPPRPRSRPRPHSAAGLHRSRVAFPDGRRCRYLWQRRAAWWAQPVAALSPIPNPRRCEPRCECVCSRFTLDDCERIPFWRSPRSANTPHRSLFHRQIGIDRHGWAPRYCPGHSACRSNCHLRASSHLFYGCRSRTGALPARQLRRQSARRHVGGHRPGHGRLPRRGRARHAGAHDPCHGVDSRRHLGRARGLASFDDERLDYDQRLHRRLAGSQALECRRSSLHAEDISRIPPRGRHHPALRPGLHLARRQRCAPCGRRQPGICSPHLRLPGKSAGRLFQAARGNPRPSGRNRGRRQVYEPQRGYQAGSISPPAAIARE